MKVNVDDQNKATIITQDPSKDGIPPMKISVPLDKLKQAAIDHVKSLEDKDDDDEEKMDNKTVPLKIKIPLDTIKAAKGGLNHIPI
jgi:hypothetical protein